MGTHARVTVTSHGLVKKKKLRLRNLTPTKTKMEGLTVCDVNSFEYAFIRILFYPFRQKEYF